MHKQVKLGEYLVKPELVETKLLLAIGKTSGILRPQEVPAALPPGVVKFDNLSSIATVTNFSAPAVASSWRNSRWSY
jgi:hypothetical protein